MVDEGISFFQGRVKYRIVQGRVMIDLLVTKYTRLGVKVVNVHCYAN